MSWEKEIKYPFFSTRLINSLKHDHSKDPLCVFQGEKNRPEKIRTMLDYLQRRGPKAFDLYLVCLRESGHDFVASYLLQVWTSRQASSLVKIPTPRVRYLYPTWTLMVDCYNRSILMCVLGAQKNHLIEIEKSLKIKCLEMCWRIFQRSWKIFESYYFQWFEFVITQGLHTDSTWI